MSVHARITGENCPCGAEKEEETVEKIKSWVRTATNNLIGSIISADTNLDLMLAHAVYFKAKWCGAVHSKHIA